MDILVRILNIGAIIFIIIGAFYKFQLPSMGNMFVKNRNEKQNKVFNKAWNRCWLFKGFI